MIKGVGRDEIDAKWQLPTATDSAECRELFQLIQGIRPEAVNDLIDQIEEDQAIKAHRFYIAVNIEFIVSVSYIRSVQFK